jgi:hypothetical protein
MATIELTITEKDLQTTLSQKINQVANLEMHITTLSRVLGEREIEIERLENLISSLNGKEESNADGRQDQVPIH